MTLDTDPAPHWKLGGVSQFMVTLLVMAMRECWGGWEPWIHVLQPDGSIVSQKRV